MAPPISAPSPRLRRRLLCRTRARCRAHSRHDDIEIAPRRDPLTMTNMRLARPVNALR